MTKLQIKLSIFALVVLCMLRMPMAICDAFRWRCAEQRHRFCRFIRFLTVFFSSPFFG
jgi:hypothetical protein